MTVAEIKAKLPEAEVVSLDPNARYLILFDPKWVKDADVEEVGTYLNEMGIKAILIRTQEPYDAVKILEMRPDPEVFKCEKCGLEFIFPGELQSHLENCGKFPPEQKWRCTNCGNGVVTFGCKPNHNCKCGNANWVSFS